MNELTSIVKRRLVSTVMVYCEDPKPPKQKGSVVAT